MTIKLTIKLIQYSIIQISKEKLVAIDLTKQGQLHADPKVLQHTNYIRNLDQARIQ